MKERPLELWLQNHFNVFLNISNCPNAKKMLALWNQKLFWMESKEAVAEALRHQSETLVLKLSETFAEPTIVVTYWFLPLCPFLK